MIQTGHQRMERTSLTGPDDTGNRACYARTVSRVYVDLDDVLSETAAALLDLLAERWGKVVEFESITHFDLTVSFDMSREELSEFMKEAHRPEILLEADPLPGAAEALGKWRAHGRHVAVLTGRPPSTESMSREWLELHAMPHDSLGFVDKYSRYDPEEWEVGTQVLELAELAADGYTLVVEDNLDTAAYLASASSAQVVLMDRPWNRDLSGVDPAVAARIQRCRDWPEIVDRFPEP